MSTSDSSTRGVRVQVRSRYVPERSSPEHGAWFFAYTVLITNEGDTSVQLISRHWIITNADGDVEEVRGPGVVGAQPMLEPGESFEYTSACPLPTAFGTMHGTYQMVTKDGERFDAEIAPFSLSMPYAVN
ncbi:Co2+/Mg2+ efflux protein ApaG [Paraliomyxa miuraensis]|uniref:Co2+/Mg2+ efflux protein ApaG n=1 Tax=Paraliomyxa miuraensis TaxID=376150 RepID=UPI0022512365|nr:Co2+/Mg2+ efflux protein ApaG [Paraliomyxa miuraensis]MCX4246698.1 Co2+/Mg2+ efflux protein ApaG [Paraliomyxa miuraensis]